ncbi:hypothetical protein LG275_03730 [Chryseomicrobium palamuruense]
MADSIKFSFEGLDEMESELIRYEKLLLEGLSRVLRELALKVIQDARKLAPIDSGDLEAALDIDDVMLTIKSLYIDLGVTASAEVQQYAMVQHEGFRRTKNGRVVYMSPGEKTRSKASFKGYSPGKKFLKNALEMNEKMILDTLAKELGV